MTQEGEDILLKKHQEIAAKYHDCKDNLVDTYEISLVTSLENKQCSVICSTLDDNYGFDKYAIKRLGKEQGIDLLEEINTIKRFICNFLDFLNDPEVELTLVERTKEQNEKRLLAGKPAIPKEHFVKLTGKLKIYIDELVKTDALSHFNYRFWVRRHKRTFKSLRYSKQVRGTTIWIEPHIKGKGILIKKEYLVKKVET